MCASSAPWRSLATCNVSQSRKALFLDRDGVLDELVFYSDTAAWEAPRRIADLKVMPQVAEPLRRAAAAGWRLFIVSNQPDYAKGKTTREELDEVHEELLRRLGVPFDATFRCFHHPDALVESLRVTCECRKPGTLFLREAERGYGVDRSLSWMIGDQDTDVLCGRAAGCRVALVENAHSASKRGTAEADIVGANLEECIGQILRMDG